MSIYEKKYSYNIQTKFLSLIVTVDSVSLIPNEIYHLFTAREPSGFRGGETADRI